MNLTVTLKSEDIILDGVTVMETRRDSHGNFQEISLRDESGNILVIGKGSFGDTLNVFIREKKVCYNLSGTVSIDNTELSIDETFSVKKDAESRLKELSEKYTVEIEIKEYMEAVQ